MARCFFLFSLETLDPEISDEKRRSLLLSFEKLDAGQTQMIEEGFPSKLSPPKFLFSLTHDVTASSSSSLPFAPSIYVNFDL